MDCGNIVASKWNISSNFALLLACFGHLAAYILTYRVNFTIFYILFMLHTFFDIVVVEIYS